MGSVIAGGAGALVGAQFGMAGLGFALGSGLYNALNAPSGPKQKSNLMDLKIPKTEYGQHIPYIYGSMRLAPHTWYNTDRVANEDTQTVGGGGKGGAPKQKQTTVTYSMSVLYGLTCHEIIGVAKSWDNGELIWRTDSGASSGTIAASNTAEQWDRLTIYTGSATQDPDPAYEALIDAAVGADSAPAYRDRGTIWVDGLQLGESGQLRNLEFEVVADGTSGPQLTYYTGITTTATAESVAQFDSDGSEVWVTDHNHSGSGASPDRIGIYNFESEAWEFISTPAKSGGYWAINADDAPQLLLYPREDLALLAVQDTLGAGTPYDTLAYKISTREYIGSYKDSGGLTDYAETYAMDQDANRALIEDNGEFHIFTISGDLPVLDLGSVTPGGGGLYGAAMVDADGRFWASRGPTYGFSRFEYTASVTHTAIAAGADSLWANKWGQCYDSSRDCIYCWSDTGSPWYILKLDCATGVWSRVNAFGYSGSTFQGQLLYAEDLDEIISIVGPSGADGIVRRIDPDDGTILHTYALPDAGGARFIGGPAYLAGIVWAPALTGFGELIFDLLTATCPTVADVQSRICIRAGLTAGQIDVTELSSISRTVCCLPWSQVSPAREPTERAMGWYFYECVMSGSKVKFVPRGGSSAATIPYEDLAASEDGNFSGDPFPLRQQNDIEIPAFKQITYINLSADYANGSEISDRLLSATSTSTEATDIQIGGTPSEAKAVADTHSLDQAASVANATITVMRADYPRLEPTDPVTITAHDGSLLRMRIVEMTDAFPLLTLRLVVDDTSVLTSAGITSVDYTSQTTVSSPARTLMELMDIPILQDADDDAGFYLAAKGDRQAWGGAAIYDSANNVDYTWRDTVAEWAIFGDCTTRLGDWRGPCVIDELNSVTVNIGAGVLVSSTRDAVLASQAVNTMLIGSEIIQFITATLVTAGPLNATYRLTRLIRGARGTEWAMVDHAAGERCVLLREGGLRRIVLTNSQLGDERYYKGVTLGRALGTAPAEPFTDTGVGLKPFAPVDARITRDGSNNATITWRRRTRLSTRYVGTLGISVPLGESTESYIVEVADADNSNFATVLRTITATSETASYTAAQQTTDGLTPGDQFYFRIYQISAIVGRGYALEHFG